MIRQHFVKVNKGLDISLNETLLAVPCPAHVEPGKPKTSSASSM